MPSDLERLHREVEAVIGAMSYANASHAPAGKWNAGQVLEHLFLTYKNTNYGLGKCLDQGAPLATSSTMRQRLGTLLVLRLGYMPKGREAPRRAVPQGIPPADVCSGILAEIEKMESGFAECERRFGAATGIMDHPFLGPLTAGEWRKFHLVHGRHHIRQIRERTK
jgi:hypothetical protein